MEIDSDSESRPNQSRRSNRQEEEEQDDPSSQVDQLMSGGTQDQQEEEDEDESNRSRKKPRTNRNRDDEEELDLDNPQEASLAERAARMQSQRSKDGYLPGSIVRVKLENFVTYSFTEFHPGPHLNMIIGPNGTGKSTIVCAIALGLGFPTKILGRAKDIASFVKKGHDEGYIEIELQARTGEQNPVIKRVLNRSDNSSAWFLNDKNSTQKECQSVRNALDIQVDNLCSFLPQDKVADFARMGPPELLRETEKAAGEKDLIVWHQKLTDLGSSLRLQMTKLESEINEMNNLEERNHALERDVRRYEERQRIERKIEILQLRIPFAEYTKAKKEYDQSRIDMKASKRELERLRAENEPLERELEKISEHGQKLKLRKDTNFRKLKEQEKDYKKLAGKLEEIEKKSEDLMSDMTSIKKREADRKKRLEKLEKQIETLENQIDNEPERIDTSGYEKRIKEINAEGRKVAADIQDLAEEQDENSAASRAIIQNRDDIQRKLSALDDHKVARMRFLQHERDTTAALNWLRENRAMFQSKIHEPVMLELSVRDPRYARAVENILPWPVLKTFVCENKVDHDNFWKEMEKQRLRINTADISNLGKMAGHNHPMLVQEVQRLGFDDYLSNLVTAPEGVLNYLCHSSKLHMIPVTLDENRVDIQAVERSGQLTRFVAGISISTVTKSNYGNRQAQTTTYEKAFHGTFTKVVDPNHKANLEKQMLDNVNEIRRREAKTGELGKSLEKLYKKKDALKAERLEMDEKKKEAGKLRANWERAKVDLGTRQKELQKLRKQPSARDEERECQRKLEGLGKKRLQMVKSGKDLLKLQLATRYEFDSYTLQLLQHEVMLRYVEDLYRVANNSFKDAERAAQANKQKYLQNKTRASTLHNKAHDLLHSAAPDLMAEVQSLSQEELERDTDELKGELETERASLDLAQSVNPAVIEQYKERQEKLKRLRASVDEKEKEKADAEHQIKKLESKWIPSLEVLVNRVSQKFSASFERLGCAGEVRISRDEDYSKWGIDILVKFRETEQLTLLTGTRQSGGERSLSTIMYLMSLLQLAVSPFSVVDEINQGMDQRAERAVHDQMVQVTCRPEASQYFLITPKLLSNLSYHERMKVLVINNGAWLPESRKLDFRGYAQAALARKKGAAR